MTDLLDTIARRRITALYGPPGAMQALVAEAIAFEAARAGLRVLVLMRGSKTAENQVFDHLATWRTHRRIEVGSRLTLDVLNLNDHPKEQSIGDTAIAYIRSKSAPSDLVVSAQLALEPGGFLAHESPEFWQMAERAAKAGCAVLLAGHCGSAPGSTEGIELADSRWRCEAGRELTVTLTGPAGEKIILRGRELGRGTLAFDQQKLETVGA